MLRAFQVLEAADRATGDAVGLLALSCAAGKHGYINSDNELGGKRWLTK